MEDLKERYYHICAKLANVRAVPGTDLKIPVFDAGHERRRKEQLERLYNRTPEQVSPRHPAMTSALSPSLFPLLACSPGIVIPLLFPISPAYLPRLPFCSHVASPASQNLFLSQVAEEEYLLQELRKIEARKKEREKRSQDLQKLITAADTTAEQRRTERKAPKKKLPQKKEAEKPVWRRTQLGAGGRVVTQSWQAHSPYHPSLHDSSPRLFLRLRASSFQTSSLPVSRCGASGYVTSRGRRWDVSGRSRWGWCTDTGHLTRISGMWLGLWSPLSISFSGPEDPPCIRFSLPHPPHPHGLSLSLLVGKGT